MERRIFNGVKKFLVLAVFMSAILIMPNFAPARAITADELQAQIDALLKQITELQNQTRKIERPQLVKLRPVKQFVAEDVRQSIPTFDRNLYYGMKNNQDVSDLQEFLTDQGYYAGPISGNFGLLTLKAVKKFQSENDIKPTGYFGVRSRTVANEIMQKLVEQICPEEEGCEDDKLPIEKLIMTADSDLSGTVGESLEIGFKVFGGSGNYDIQVIDSNFFDKMSMETKTIRDTIILFGVPTKAGVFSITFLAKDLSSNNGAYVKERFTIVIKDKSSRRNPPIISGIKGPTVLKTGEEGIWTIEASDPNNGSLNYKVIWGDEVYREESSKELAPRAIPFKQTATFSHIYYREGVYNPTFYIVNDRGAEAKTSISVNVEGKEKIVSEQVKCVFNNSELEQKCYTAPTNYSNSECSGTGTCVTDIKGIKGDTIIWKSTCGGYAYTVMDGQNEYAEFNCGPTTIPVPPTLPPTPTPAITVLSPNGGESFTAGGQMNIHWNTSNWPENTIALSLQDANNIHVVEIGVLVPNTGSYSWNIPTGLSSGSYKIRAGGSNNNTASDQSNTSFSIVAATTTTPSITVLSPNGGEVSSGPNNFAIQYNILNFNSLIRPQLTLELEQNGSIIGTPYANTGALLNIFSNSQYWNFSWAPNTYYGGTQSFNTPLGGNYKIRATLYSNGLPISNDSSDAPFSIVAPTPTPTTPSITVLSPNGGESLNWSGVNKITWNYNNISKVSIALYKDNSFFSWIVQNISIPSTTNAAASYDWTPSKTISEVNVGNNIFKIYITGYQTDMALSDKSDAPFSIVSATTATPAITVLSPNGGESLNWSGVNKITWNYSGLSSVSIALYKNNTFVNWIATNVNVSVPLTTNTTASYDWTPSNTISQADIGNNLFKVRVGGYKTGGEWMEDWSDQSFSIVSGVTSFLKNSELDQMANTLESMRSAVNKMLKSVKRR